MANADHRRVGHRINKPSYMDGTRDQAIGQLDGLTCMEDVKEHVCFSNFTCLSLLETILFCNFVHKSDD